MRRFLLVMAFISCEAMLMTAQMLKRWNQEIGSWVVTRRTRRSRSASNRSEVLRTERAVCRHDLGRSTRGI